MYPDLDEISKKFNFRKNLFSLIFSQFFMTADLDAEKICHEGGVAVRR